MALEPAQNAAKFVNFLKFWVCSWSLRDFAVIRLHCHLRCFFNVSLQETICSCLKQFRKKNAVFAQQGGSQGMPGP